MRNRNISSFALILGLIATLGTTPGLLAQEGEPPIPDPDPNFDDIEITCNGEQCDDVGGRRIYEVDFLPTAYIPEQTYPEAMVVLVVEGELAFRVQSNDVIVDPQGNEGEPSTEIPLLVTDQVVAFGQSPKDASPQPIYSDNGTLSDAECSRPSIEDLCLLDPAKFSDQVTFVKLEAGDIVYLPAGSTCFFCNVTDTGDEHARVLVWAPGTDFSWYEQGQLFTPDSRLIQGQGLRETRGWMLNPGSPCH